MACRGNQLDQEDPCCSICKDPLKDPVTIPCGHSFCKRCIKHFWDREDEKEIYSCPQCSQTFTQRYSKGVTEAVSEVTDAQQNTLSKAVTNMSLTDEDALPLPAEPETRAEFLRYSLEISFDPNTLYRHLSLSEGNRKVTYMEEKQSYSTHRDRFTLWAQVLSTESLTERCYWEVEFSGTVRIAVTYKDISRKESDSRFGNNDKSFALYCDNSNDYIHEGESTHLSGLQSSRVGVYLDHSAGLLSFYSVTETMTLLHRVQTTFTQPLYVGVWLRDVVGDTAELKLTGAI